MNKFTFEDMNERLCDLDTEYREALAKAVMELNYISGSPLQLSYGTKEQQQEWQKFKTRPLKSKEIIDITKIMQEEMKGDYQYGRFKEVASYYMNMAEKVKNKNREAR